MIPVSRQRQQGMALMISLIVLVVVSILGATAMRSAAFQSKVSVNAQVTQVLFQSAESGLSAMQRIAAAQIAGGVLPQEAGHVFAAAYNGVPSRACFNAAGVAVRDANAARVVVSSNEISLPHLPCAAIGDNPVSITAVVARPPCALDMVIQAEGYSLGIGGWGFRSVMTRSFAEIPGLGFNKSHVQLWAILAPSAGITTCV